MKRIILAFDIERSGATNNFETIGIGASVIDDNFTELDSIFLPAFFPKNSKEPTIFEKRCWDEFWSKYPKTLETLTYKGKLSKTNRHKEMITQFQEFRKKWEQFAEKNKIDYYLASDNCIYDGGFINDLIYKHLPETLPIPYSTNGKYGAFIGTHNVQRGFLMAMEPSYKKNWGFSKKINEIYNVPNPNRKHDHNPTNDAYCIAFELQVLYAIQEGKIKRRY